MRPLRLIFAMISLLGCAARQPAPRREPDVTKAPPKQEEAPRFALIWRGATFYSAADAKASHARPYDGEHDADKDIDQVWVSRIVAEHGDFVEVENVLRKEAASHCYSAEEDLQSYGVQLRLFVRRSELRQVTTREVTVTGADGSSVMLAPGVAILATGDRQVARVDGLRVATRLPEDAMGIGYRPGRPYSVEGVSAVIKGDQKIISEAGEISDAEHASVVAPSDLPKRGNVWIDIVGECGKYHVSAPVQRLNLDTRYEGSGGRGFALGCDHCPRVDEGTPLLYPDGRPAGTTLRTVYLSEWKDVAVVSGTLYCGGQLLRYPEEGQEPKPSWYFTICVPKDKVVEDPGRDRQRR